MNPKPSSLQAILKRRQQEEFVGREEQVALFQENLALPYDNSRRRFIFSVWGQGGVGKTSLLQQFSQIAREKGSLTALTNEDESDMPQVLGRIAEQFKEQGFHLETFSKRYKDYREKKSEIEGDLQAPHGLAGMIGRTLTHTLFFVGDAVPGVRKGLEYLPQEKIAEHVGGYADYLSKKLKNKDEVRLMLNPVEELTPLFLQDLRKVAEAKDLALFFDTFERTSDFVDSWLIAVLEGQHGDMPGNIVLIIAGRNELAKSKWTPFEGLIARLSLEPFTDEEALDYLNRRGITDEQVVETILKLCRTTTADNGHAGCWGSKQSRRRGGSQRRCRGSFPEMGRRPKAAAGGSGRSPVTLSQSRSVGHPGRRGKG